VLRDPQSLNPYQYAKRNPLRFIDPQGTSELLNDLTMFDPGKNEWEKHQWEPQEEPAGPQWIANEYGLEGMYTFQDVNQGTGGTDPSDISWLTGNRETQLTAWEKFERAAEDVEDAWDDLEEAQIAAREGMSERDAENLLKLMDLADAHEALQAAQQAFALAYEQYRGSQ
jgi:hypothetical protein